MENNDSSRNNKTNFSLDYIYSLPIRRISVNKGECNYLVRYDESEKIIFNIDKSGQYTGQYKCGVDLDATIQKSDSRSEDIGPEINKQEPTEQNATEAISNKSINEDIETPSEPAEIPDSPESAEHSTIPEQEETQATAHPISPETNAENQSEVVGEFVQPQDTTINEIREVKQRKPAGTPRRGIVYSLLLLQICLTIGSFLLTSSMIFNLKENISFLNQHSEEPTVNETEPEENHASADTLMVLQLNKAKIPGEAISAEDFTMIPVNQASYVVATEGYCTDTDLEKLDGLQYAVFKPAGAIMSFKDATLSYTPVNPWQNLPDGYTTVSLPITAQLEDLNNLQIGNYIKLVVTTQTKTSSPSETEPQDAASESGVEHDSSVLEAMVKDTYTFRNAIIVDLENETSSLIPIYSALSEIPEILQEEILTDIGIDVLQTFIPVKIKIAVPSDHAELIDTLEKENMTIDIEKTGVNIGNEVQMTVRHKMDTLVQTMIKVGDISNGEE